MYFDPYFCKKKMAKCLVSTPFLALCSISSQHAVLSIPIRNRKTPPPPPPPPPPTHTLPTPPHPTPNPDAVMKLFKSESCATGTIAFTLDWAMISLPWYSWSKELFGIKWSILKGKWYDAISILVDFCVSLCICKWCLLCNWQFNIYNKYV